MNKRSTHPHQIDEANFSVASQRTRSLPTSSAIDTRSTLLQFPRITSMMVYSFACPILAMLAIGFWIDAKQGNTQSALGVLVVIGLGLGLLNAWHSAVKADREFRMEQEEREG